MENLEDSSEKGKKPEKEYLATIKIKESIRLMKSKDTYPEIVYN